MASCSIKALSSADKRAYTAVAKRKGVTLKAARLARVEKLLGAAIAEHDALIAHVQGVYPGLINTEGVFLEDLRAQEFDAGQLELDLRAPVKKKAKKKAKAKEKKDGVRGKEKETKARAEKPSPAKVLKKGKAKGPEPAPKGEAKPTTAAAKDKEKPAKRQQAAPKTPKEESQPARQEEQEQAEQKRTEPVSPRVDKDEVFIATDEWQHFPKDAIAPAGAEFRLSLTDEDQREIRLIQPTRKEEPIPTRVEKSDYVADLITTIETSTDREKTDAVVALLEAALVGTAIEDPLTGKAVSTEGALEAANNENLLWTPADIGNTTDAFTELLQIEYSDKKVTTFAHRQAMWDFAIQHNILRDAYIAVTAGGEGIKGFTPTKPPTSMQARFDVLGITSTPMGVNRDATDKLIKTLAGILTRLDNINNNPYTSKEINSINRIVAKYIGQVNLDAKFGGDELTLNDWLTPVHHQYPFRINWATDGTLNTPEAFESIEDILKSMAGLKGRTKIFDNRHKPITKPLPLGVVKPIVKSMMNKFNADVRPDDRTYKNVAELQRKDPDIYQEAIDSRPDGNPIPATAAGYAFGNRILIFSDNIGTRQELTFTVLHEVIGHFGLGSLMSTKNFRTLMDDIYRADPTIREAADILMGKSDAEAKAALKVSRRTFLRGMSATIGSLAAGPIGKLGPVAKAIVNARKLGIDFVSTIGGDLPFASVSAVGVSEDIISFTPSRSVIDYGGPFYTEGLSDEIFNVPMFLERKWEKLAFTNIAQRKAKFGGRFFDLSSDFEKYNDDIWGDQDELGWLGELDEKGNRIREGSTTKIEQDAITDVYRAIKSEFGTIQNFLKNRDNVLETIIESVPVVQKTASFLEEEAKFLAQQQATAVSAKKGDKLKKSKKQAETREAPTRGLERYEAIEEALADRAAELNNSIIQKVWNAIRRFFRTIGFESNEDMTRFFIDQSLRYQRTGLLPDASAPAVYQHLKVLNERYIEGRASVPNTPSETTFYSEVKEAQKSVKLPGRSPGEKLDAFLKRHMDREGLANKAIGAWGDVKKAIENIQPMNNIAQFSEGVYRLYQAFVGQAQELAHLKTKYINGTEYTHRVKNRVLTALGLQEGDAPSKEDREQADRAAEMQTMHHRNVEEEVLRKLPTLTKRNANNEPEIDYGLDENKKPVLDKNKKLQGVAAARAVGEMTREQIDAGIEIPIMGDDGLPAKDAKGKLITESFKLDEDLSDNAWRIVQETRNTIDEAALDTHLNKLRGILQNQSYLKTTMMEDNEGLTATDLVIIEEILAVYERLFNEGATVEGKGMKWLAVSKDRATRFLYNTLRVLDRDGSNQKLKDWRGEYKEGTQDEKNMEEFRISKDADIQSVIAKLPTLGSNRQNAEIMGSEIKVVIENIHALTADLTNSELDAKHTIATAYVPFDRPGKYQVRVQAYDEQDNPIRLSDNLQAGLIYARHDDIAEVKKYVAALTDALSKSAPINSILDAKNKVQNNVTFRGVFEIALDSAPLAGVVDYSEIFNTLLRAGIELNAVDRQKLVVLTAAQHSTARHNLRKEFVPGWNPDIQRGVREHLERQANIAAKNLYHHVISDTLTVDNKLWHGDAKKHKELQDKFDVALASKNKAALFIAKRDMDRYQLQFEHAMGTQKEPYIIRLSLDKNGERKKEMVNGKALGGHYLNKAIGMVSQYTAMHGMPAVTGDQKLGEVSSVFMTVGTAAQLGGAIAPAAINSTSIFTHAAPLLATYNPKTGFGFGHGMPAALRELTRAMQDLSLFKDGRLDATGSSKAIRDIINAGEESLMAKYGLTMDEAEMLFEHTDKGTMTANITNVLTGTNAFLKGTAAAKTIETWMFLFTKTEQYNRRVTGLAAYRLERDRMLEASGLESHEVDKLSEAQKKELSNSVDEAIDFSQGNYEKFNHPSIAQGPMLKYLWVYKQFQAITIVLMRHLGHKERAMFLAFFIMTAGLKGIPFEEDFADLIDTLMQTFGINWDGLDAEMVSLMTSLGLPAGLLMRGPIDHYIGITYSTRISQSNVIPGSGFLKAGADKWRQTTDVIGPVFSAWSGILGAGGMAGQYVLETLGLKDDVTSGADVLRTGAGLSALKNYARGITYFIDGTITNERGQLVSKEAGPMTIMFQMLGFYPASATKQYDVNRINSDVTQYSKMLIRGYVDAYIKADRAGKRHIKRQVKEWNKNVGRRSPLYISDFGDKVRRSGKSAKQSSVERTIKALPKAPKRFGKGIAEAFGLSPRGLEIE